MKDLYLVLGISKDACDDEVKSAYRKKVMNCHPDQSDQPVEKFHEVRKAYEVLSDPERRKEYDDKRRNNAERVNVRRQSRPRSAGPYRDVHRSRFYGRPFGSSGGLFEELDALFGSFIPGMFGGRRARATGRDLHVELVLTPREARDGGRVPLDIPVEVDCPHCGGRGLLGRFLCHECRGEGRAATHRSIEISLPPGVGHGERARISLDESGLPGARLNVIVTVAR